MANESAASAATGGDGQRLLTLTEVAKRTKLSMPTLQKYKKRYGDRIPSVGKGRTQRYPENALPVFETLREENMARRGRPRKAAAGAAAASTNGRRRRGRPRKAAPGAAAVPANGRRRRGRPRKAAAAGGGGGERLLTLTEVAKQTKVSYPTLLRYVKTHGSRIPSVGSGRRRRYRPEAVAVFTQLRSESRRGRRPGTGAKAATGARRGRPPGTGAKRRGRPPGSGAKRRGRPPGRPPAAAAGGGISGAVTSLLRKLEQRLAKIESEIRKPLRLVRR